MENNALNEGMSNKKTFELKNLNNIVVIEYPVEYKDDVKRTKINKIDCVIPTDRKHKTEVNSLNFEYYFNEFIERVGNKEKFSRDYSKLEVSIIPEVKIINIYFDQKFNYIEYMLDNVGGTTSGYGNTVPEYMKSEANKQVYKKIRNTELHYLKNTRLLLDDLQSELSSKDCLSRVGDNIIYTIKQAIELNIFSIKVYECNTEITKDYIPHLLSVKILCKSYSTIWNEIGSNVEEGLAKVNELLSKLEAPKEITTSDDDSTSSKETFVAKLKLKISKAKAREEKARLDKEYLIKLGNELFFDWDFEG